MNSLLIESECFDNENFLLPKSSYVCILRFIGEEGVAQEKEELQHKEHGVVVIHEDDVREEREADVQS